MFSTGTDVSLPFAERPLPFERGTPDDLERRFGNLAGRRRPPRVDPPPPGPVNRNDTPRVDVRLYVSADSVNSSRAILALQEITRIFPAAALNIYVMDVALEIEAATRDRVLFTPTLIVTDLSNRSTRVLGDLSNSDVMVDLLRTMGVEPV
jgi:hypothetical protein